MKVICVGFWKTGTKSMSKALTDLGYNVYDYAEQSFLLRSLWDKFFDGTVTDDDIYQALKDVDALIDGPTIVFWEEIYRVFPQAKIIFTMRDEDKWWKSLKGMNDKFYSGSRAAILKYLLLTTPTGYSFTKFGNKIMRYGFGLEADNIIFSFSWSRNEKLYKLKYRQHNAYVLHTVPDNKRLVHKPSHGWSPLCEYLGKEVPGNTYPHQNKNASIFTSELMSNPIFIKLSREMLVELAVFVLILAAAVGWWFNG